ncbi:D-alanine--D-alanine ligase [Dactylosporangium aurantiacum]|uniref:D-alanine--D-alanine ligase n=1 Tax=Dactylosporangium aurantiacum TaxID=35754 RepID=A0A9Q9II41_9ACTN|nr:D-alanine--D-alanine ligase [Dactylosporangium aurantiacum]MDG6104410.1 D-alanine--D-alanine ligase [Dactylosporangium aurantiacum]UWZ56031.1 D-alanine--D-alanine ligase [Dactylosporangium aurantiacum]
METPEKTRVAVVFGGGSTEHAVSSVGAADLLDALDTDEFEIVPIGVTHEGRWVLSAAARAERPSTDLVSAGAAVTVVDAGAGVASLGGVDVVFPVLQGVFGDEGTVQGLLEMADLPYVGSGVLAAAVAMDHDFSRKLVVAAGLPVAPYVVLRGDAEVTAADRDRLGLPAVVRPARGAGGVTEVTDWAQLPPAVAAARAVDAKVVVAAAPAGRRITVGVLDTGAADRPEASVPGEVVGGRTTAPAELDRDVERRVRDLAVAAFVTLDCAGLAVVECTVTPDGQVFFDRIDTMPGFDPGAPFPVVWQASGVAYQTLISRLVKAAVRRGTGLH